MRAISFVFIFSLAGLTLFSCQPTPKAPVLQAPLFSEMDHYDMPITTSSAYTQRFFNQAMVLASGMNHAEAERSFREGARLDSTCAMCYWGIGFVLGSNINAAMDQSLLDQAWQAVDKAQSLSSSVSKKEQGLITALTKRYPKEAQEDLGPYNQAFAEALKIVHDAFPEDLNIASVYAEALMDVHPWDLWNRDGSPKPWTPQITQLLEEVLDKDPKHAGATHFYIHAVEASRKPQLAMAAADTLGSLVPYAGHLVHMPSHIYIRTGDYHKGSLVNEWAVLADSSYITQCQAQGMYPLSYYPHNYHFLAATAALEGRGELAVRAAFQTAKYTDKELMLEPGYGTFQHYSVIPHYVLTKFGQWDRILELAQPEQAYPKAVWHYARGMAFLGKGNTAAALGEWEALNRYAADSSLKTVNIWEINTVDHLVKIASLRLGAELAAQAGRYDEAIRLLQEAVAIEDDLNYNEPPDWFFSIRHSLGAILIEAGQFAEAERIYQEDLAFYPENGWALTGLIQSLEGQQKPAEAEAVKKRLEKAWQWADFKLESSRIMGQLVAPYPRDALRGFALRGFQQPEALAGIRFCGPRL